MMKRVQGILSTTILFCFVVCIPSQAQNTPRLEIQPKDSVASKLYVALFDRDIKKNLDPENFSTSQSYTKMAELAAALSFAYTLPKSEHHQDSFLIKAIQKICDPFEKRQNPNGHFERAIADHETTSAETAAIVEAFIYVLNNVRNELEGDRNKTYIRVIKKGLDALHNTQQTTKRYEKVKICGVLALGGYTTGDSSYTKQAKKLLHEALKLFDESGQVLVGPGPDLKYSLECIRYLFLYRWIMDDSSLDSTLIRSLDWCTKVFTTGAVPLEGMSTETWSTDGRSLVPLMGAFAYYSQQQAKFEQFATHYLSAFIDLEQSFSAQNGAYTFLLGSHFHEVPDKVQTIPYDNYTHFYENEHSTYYLVGMNYQTAVTLRGRLPLKGMQTWSYKGEPPLIFPKPRQISKFSGQSNSTNLMDVSWLPNPPYYSIESVTPGIHLLMMQQDDLMSAYLFTQDTTTIVYRQSESSEALVSWNISLPICANMKKVTQTEILYEDSQARLLAPFTLPEIESSENHKELIYSIDNEFAWFTFAGPESFTITRPVTEGLVLVQVRENGEKRNVLLNMSRTAFTKNISFPGTTIAIPEVDAISAKMVKSN